MKTGQVAALAAAGIAVGLLFTTKKGAELRKTISHKAGDLRHKLDRASHNTIENVVALKDTVSRQVKGLGDDARKRINEILDEGENGLQKAKNKIKTGSSMS